MLHFGCTDTVGTLLKCPDHQGVLSSGGKGGGFELQSCLGPRDSVLYIEVSLFQGESTSSGGSPTVVLICTTLAVYRACIVAHFITSCFTILFTCNK